MSEKVLSAQVKKYLESDELTERQRETIQRFDKNKRDWGHLNSIYTRYNYARSLNHLGKQNHKPYEDMTEEDIINFLDSRNINETTRNHYIITFRTFFKYILESGKSFLKFFLTKQAHSIVIRFSNIRQITSRGPGTA